MALIILLVSGIFVPLCKTHVSGFTHAVAQKMYQQVGGQAGPQPGADAGFNGGFNGGPQQPGGQQGNQTDDIQDADFEEVK